MVGCECEWECECEQHRKRQAHLSQRLVGRFPSYIPPVSCVGFNLLLWDYFTYGVLFSPLLSFLNLNRSDLNNEQQQ
jgi:hypothetical protein